MLKLNCNNHYAEVLSNITNEELAWLGGIIDGEGSVSIQATIRKNGNLILVPFITVVNSDQGIIDKCSDILNKLQIKHSWYQRKTMVNRKTHDNPEPSTTMIRDNTCNMRVEKMNRVELLLRATSPFLFGIKKYKAQKVLEFINSRNNGLITRNEKGQIVRNKYTEEQIKIAGEVRTSWSARPVEELLACSNVIRENKI